MSELKNIKVTFRLTEDEKKYIDEVAESLKKKYNLSGKQSDAIRYLIGLHDPKKETEITNVAIELKRIGNNLNQLTKLVNEGRIIDCRKELGDIQKEIDKSWLCLKLEILKQNQVK